MERPLVDKKYQLKKFPGKGGWTFAEIPEVAQDKNTPFGWVKVRGNIDNYELKYYKLMPMGNGKLFLPVKAAIRRIIDKEAGDFVQIKLYEDERLLVIPEEIIDCFKNEPQKVYSNFMNFTEGEQKAYLDWVYSAKKEETKVERIIKMLNQVAANKKFYDME